MLPPMYCVELNAWPVLFHFITRKVSTSTKLAARVPTNSYWNPDYHKKHRAEIPAADQNKFGEKFRPLQIFPPKIVKREWIERGPSTQTLPPRWTRMTTTQDWTNVWPTAHSFKASVVPLPIRMSFVKDKQLKIKQPLGKHANLELMKIPNFLHLTPLAIKKHCSALESFCTEWPDVLKTDEDRQSHFPLEISTCDYVMAGPSVRDPRSRIVTLRVQLGSLGLDEHARWKFIKLVGDRYDKKTDAVTIVTDRCPARHQNRDYAMYLLTALVYQSRKVEAWESEIEEEDRVRYIWDGTKSKTATYAYLKAIGKANVGEKEAKTQPHLPDYVVEGLSSCGAELSDEFLDKQNLTKSHATVVEEYFDEGENPQRLRAYAKSIRKLLAIPSLD